MTPTILGPVVDWAARPDGLDGHTAEARFSITFLGAGAVRVQIARADEDNELLNPYSLLPDALERLAKKHGWAAVDAPVGQLRYASSAAMLAVKLAPFRVELCTSDGHPLCVDEPGLGTIVQGTELSVYKQLQPGERFIGLGEKVGPLDRRGKAYTHWNTDKFAYTEEDDPIYLSTPFYIGVHHGMAYGFYLDNPAKSHFNFGASNERFASITVESGLLDYILIAGPTVAEVIERYTELTGRTPLPPRWALGLQQCRYSYYPDTEVTTLAETFRQKGIPADVIYLDIHYMDAYKVFTWNAERFRAPEAMLRRLHSMGFKVAVITDPGIKVEKGYPAYDTGKAEGHFIHYPDGSIYQGQVWPGWCAFPDFTDPKARAWWADQVRILTDVGIEGLWTDMNEPATWGQRFPDVVQFSYEGQAGTSHKQAHNVYGMQMARATFEGATEARPGLRPFVLTRAGYSGVQRYAAVWTGDNISDDKHMLLGVRLLNAMGLAGVGFCGMDIGGFVGDADRCLFARWITIGAFSPLCRIHTMVDSRDSEPWSYGEKIEAISRNFVSLRYRLLPLFYSLFRQMELTGMPVQRSLAITDTHAWQTYDHRYHNQFCVGEGLLICPCSAFEEYAAVYLPERGTDPVHDKWYYLYEDTRWAAGEPVARAPLDLLPAFVAPSTILPMRSLTQHAGEKDDGVLTLHLYKGSRANAFELFWDNGDGYGYQGGDCYARTITYQPGNNGDVLTLAPRTGLAEAPWHTLHLILHGFAGAKSADIEGLVTPLKQAMFRFVEPLPAFDPFGNDQSSHACSILLADMELREGEMDIVIG